MKREWRLVRFVVALLAVGFMVWAASQLRGMIRTSRSPAETNEGKPKETTYNLPGDFAKKRTGSQPSPSPEEKTRVFLRVAEGGKYKQVSPEGVVTWIDPSVSPPPTPTDSVVFIEVGPLNLTPEEMDKIGFPWNRPEGEEKKDEGQQKK